MANINTGKLIAGGLAAGFVINVVESVVNLFLIKEPAEEMLTTLGLDPIGGSAGAGFVLLGFALGFLTVWTYAAIRPRYGPGPGTAMKAGLATWIAFYLFGNIGMWLMGMLTTSFLLIVLGYSLMMMLAAAHVGGMVYKEE